MAGTKRSIVIREDVEKKLQAYIESRRLKNYSTTVNDLLDYALSPDRQNKGGDNDKLGHQTLYSLNAHRKKTGRDLAIQTELLMQFMLDLYTINADALNNAGEADRDAAAKKLDQLIGRVAQVVGKSNLLPEDDEGEV